MSEPLRWRSMEPAEVLEHYVALTAEMVAYVLQLLHTRGALAGRPDPGMARKLIRDGKLSLIDPSQERTHWRVSSSELRRYLEGPGTSRRGVRGAA